MMVHPRLLRLLEAGRGAQESGDLSSLSALCVDARAFVLEQRGVFEALALALPLRGELGDRIGDLRSLYAQALEVIDGIERSAADHNAVRLGYEIDRLENTFSELLPALGELDALERSVPRQSPVPMINRFIRIAANVREGFLPPARIRENFGAVIQTANTLRQNHRRFRALHQAPPALLEQWDEQFGRLEGGCGAIVGWLQSGDDKTLIDGLTLLKQSSSKLMELLAKMDEIARKNVRFSSLLALDELLRAAHGLREGRVEPDIVGLSAASLQALGSFYASALDSVAAFPLAFMLRTEWEALRAEVEPLRDVALPWFERLRIDPRRAVMETDTLEVIRARVEAASSAHQRLQDALESTAQALRGAPNVEAVVDALGRLSIGSMTVAAVVDRVQHFIDVHNDLIGQIDQTADPNLGEMRALLVEQGSAVEDMAASIEDGDETHLRHGFMRLCAIHPRIMEMQSELRAVADAQRAARERTVSCFRCGATNPATGKYCQACNAVLPMAQADDTVYADLDGTTGGVGTPASLRRLQSIFDRAQAGGDLASLAQELDVEHRQFETIAREFDSGLGARARRGDAPMLSEFADAFRTQLEGLLRGVASMREAARGGRAADMHPGLHTALEAGREMQSAQQELQAGLGVHSPVS